MDKNKQKAIDKEEKRLFFNKFYRDKNGNIVERTKGKLIPKPTPPTSFTVTPVGISKRKSGKYERRKIK